MMSYEAFKFWFSVVQTLLTAAVWLYVYLTAKRTARKKDVDTQLSNLNARMTAIEQEVHHIPTQKDIRELHDMIGGIHADMKELSGSFKGLARAVDLINEHLLNRGEK